MADAAGVPPRPQAVKPLDAWWTVIAVDPIATRLATALAPRSAVTPTRITVVAHLLGLTSLALFAAGEVVAGGIVFELRFVLDCVDGKVARLSGRTSRFGFVLDAFGDRILVTANLAALAWTCSPLLAVVLAGAYPLSHHLVEVRDGLLLEAGVAKQLDRATATGWGAALARRRLYPMPVSIDAEHLALFIAPLLTLVVDGILEPLLIAVAVFFVAQVARYAVGVLTAARAVDRARGAAGPPP